METGWICWLGQLDGLNQHLYFNLNQKAIELNNVGHVYIPLRWLKEAILKLPLLDATSANCYYGNSSLQKRQDFRGIGVPLLQTAIMEIAVYRSGRTLVESA